MEKINYEIKYSETFKKEIEEVFIYIVKELQNIIIAENLLQLVNTSIIKRSKDPIIYKSFKLKDGGTYNWYKININNYYAFYTVENNVMTMRRFIYKKRNINKIF